MWVFLLLVGVTAAFAEVSVQRFDGEKVYRVTPHHEEQIDVLHYLSNNMQIDFWRPDSVEQVTTGMTIDFRVEADKYSEVERFLQQNGLDYDILINNLQDVLDEQFDTRVRSAGYQYEKYNPWEKIEAWTADIANEYPGLVSRSQIGTTYEGRSMYLLKVGKPGVNKKAIFMDCGFHAREWISPAFCQWFVKEAVRTYGKETIMTLLLDNLDFYILPVLNIDGYVYTWTTSRMWRKTRSVNPGSKCIGTDPNRNFDAGWCTVGASRDPCFDTYCGSAPESQRETKALADFIREHKSTIKAYLTIHSYSQMLLYPYSYTYELTKNNVELNALAKAASKELKTLHGTEYTYGPGAATIYPAAGGSDDWAYDQGIKYSFTFELRDTGRYGFALPESQIKATCEETLVAIKYIANYVLEHLY
ncbi:carboxypeptidase B-like isoform X3 [Elgaria multicarinata webbii]|uniref:carboxypeptidase B-like isoform X3 n=1 Tax=Elgaria multicarinata webbii TaxID=159646 RepID=UPI002FCCD39E